MRYYESIIVLDPESPAEDREQVSQKIQTVVEDLQGEIVSVDDWGKRKLAYAVKNKRYGYMMRTLLKAPVIAVGELERLYRHSEPVIKHMTVILTDKDLANKELLDKVPVALDAPDTGRRRRLG